jgi:PleD family two-component response regulator
MFIAARMRHAVPEMAMAHGGSENGVVTICAGVAAARPHQSEVAADLLLREADRVSIGVEY